MNFPTEFKGWKTAVEGKWIIVDSDAVVSLIKYKQLYVLDQLKELIQGFVYIHPALLELMATNSSTEKLQRSKLLVDYEFTELSLTQKDIKLANNIRESLPLNCQPSPTDLYFGATLARYSASNALLLTANIKDFPLPIFVREGSIMLQNKTSIKPLTLLSIDMTKLV